MQRIAVRGLRAGRLTGIRRCYKKHCVWYCEARCDCGQVVEVRVTDLNRQRVRSCGCLRVDISRALRTTHGLWGSPTYVSWQCMLARCHNRRHRRYTDYGGRGITVCQRWRDSFEAFLADMGERPEDMTLDRINVNGDYEPDNCRWADKDTQAANKRQHQELRT